MGNYRKCGGCHFPQPYCDCKDYGLINFDTNQAVTSNKLELAYFGSQKYDYAITTQDGVDLVDPQFQGMCFDGNFVYISVCDKNDRNGCILKYSIVYDNDNHTSQLILIRTGNNITDCGHMKIGYDFNSERIIVARRMFRRPDDTIDWDDKYAFEIDPNTLNVTAQGNMSHQITSFVQYDKELYYLDSSANHFYKLNSIDVSTGNMDRELVATLPLPGEYYELLSGSNNGMQTWTFDGRTVMCIRNNPQFAFFYDIITKRTTLSKIGDISDGRVIGEIEASYTWNGESIFISACDISDAVADLDGKVLSEHYIQFWSYFINKGSSGSEDVRENTHPTYYIGHDYWGREDDPNDRGKYQTTNRNIIVDVNATNFYCNGSRWFPFHSVHEAIAYYKNHPNAKGIMFKSDYSGLIKADNLQCDFAIASNETVSVRMLCDNCRLVISDFDLHDCEFEDSYVFLRSNNSISINVYDNPYWNKWHGCVITIGLTAQGTLKQNIINHDSKEDIAFVDCSY